MNHLSRKTCSSAFFLLFLFHFTASAQVEAPSPVLPVPTASQLKWQQLEYYAFVHLSVNTYTDMAWGYGDEAPQTFNPTELDCRQWARISKEAGMKAIILTAKHHSGFCLWPSEYTEYSVKNCPWKGGKGDIVREMADACKEYGLKFGVYLSPWDRNHPDYGKPEYIAYFRNQLRELLTNYGEVFEIWFDGANGGSGYYGGANETRNIDRSTYYDWENTYALVRSLQPNIVIWNDGGERADLRWVGTEAGYIGETNWSLLHPTGDVPEDMLRYGVENGEAWVPGEVNTSIRPEWFYHPKEDEKVKTLPQLMDIYHHSIGRNATLLLNFPIMPNGLIHPKDEQAVLEFGAAVQKAFAKNLAKGAVAEATNVRGNDPRFGADNCTDGKQETYWATNDTVNSAALTLHFKKPQKFNRFLVQEYIPLGQRVKSFMVEAWVDGQWVQIAKETTIGYKRILRFNTVTASKLRLKVLDAKNCPLISNIEIYNAPIILSAPTIIRDQSGTVRIIPADVESQLYYTLDGTLPTHKSAKYTAPFETAAGKIVANARAYDEFTKKYSPLSVERFDRSRKLWKIMGMNEEDSQALLDGDPNTQWYQDKGRKMPVELVIDLGETVQLSGFKYLPDQHWWGSGIISKYSFAVSTDGHEWKEVNAGEFSNIKNNPILQVKSFAPTYARYIKLTALGNTQNNEVVGYAELDVITN